MKKTFIIIMISFLCNLVAVESEPVESELILYFSENHINNTSYHFGYNPFNNVQAQNIATEFNFPTLTTWNNETQGWNTGFVQGIDFTDFTLSQNEVFLFSVQNDFKMKLHGEFSEVNYSFEITENPKYFFVYYPLTKKNSNSNQFLNDFSEKIISVSYWDSENMIWVVDNDSNDDNSYEIKSGEVYRLLVSQSFNWEEVVGGNDE